MSRVLVLGVSGMLGSNVYSELLHGGVNVMGTSREGSVLEGHKTLEFDVERDPRRFLTTQLPNFDYVINCIGLIPHKFGSDENLNLSRAIKINSIFPNLLADVSVHSNTRIIQIATDCVFKGDRGHYSEISDPDPIDIYGITKAIGEVNHKSTMNLRCSVIGVEKNSQFSLLSWFLAQPLNSTVFGYTNHFWNGVTALSFSKIVKGVVESDIFKSGTYHLIPSNSVTKFELLELFARFGNRNDIKVIPTENETRVNRELSTVRSDFTDILWKFAGYQSPPSIEEMVYEVFNKKSDEVR